MAENPTTTIAYAANHGRWGGSHPLGVPDNYCEEMVNVDLWQSGLGRKRPGMTALSMTGGPAYPSIVGLHRHVPGSDDAVAELWAVSYGLIHASNNIHRRSAAGVWTDIGDTSGPEGTAMATHNGKLFFVGDQTYVTLWDGTAFRPVGVPQAGNPTVANTGAGAYAATLRYYKVAFTVQATGVTTRRGELSARVSFTPSGTGTAARVTMPSAPSYTGPGGHGTVALSTHWELYASADDLNYFLISTLPIGSTTYDDAATPSAYSGNQPPLVGNNGQPVPCKAISVDASLNRLLFGGGFSSGTASRIWFTPVLGSLNVGDDERITMNGYLDVGSNDEDAVTAISPSLDGTIYVFKRRHVYRIVKTGNVDAPYVVSSCVSHVVGTFSQRSACAGEKTLTYNALETIPCVYFSSERGLHRVGSEGLEYLGAQLEDVWTMPAISMIGLGMPVLYFPKRRQVWVWHGVWLDQLAIYMVADGGWTLVTGRLGTGSIGGCLFPSSPSSSAELVPYIIGSTTGLRALDVVWRFDPAALDDAGVAFQGLITLPARAPFGLNRHVETNEPTILGEAVATSQVTVTAITDLGVDSFASTVSLAPDVAGQKHVARKAEGADVGKAIVVQITVGDATPINGAAWSVDELAFTVMRKEVF